MSYKIHGPWKLEDSVNAMGTIIELQVTDLIDHHGHVFGQGAWRVRKDGKNVKTFKGETAWSDALRLFGDERYAALRNNY